MGRRYATAIAPRLLNKSMLSTDRSVFHHNLQQCAMVWATHTILKTWLPNLPNLKSRKGEDYLGELNLHRLGILGPR